MTNELAIKILDEELRHTKVHLKDSGKAPEYYEELGNYEKALVRAIEAIYFMEEHQKQGDKDD